jgi:PHD/YefM family antitoxin component YafN of YafNO toxin-antitoxin module
MKKVLEALKRNEPVTILYHGQEKAVITSIDNKTSINAAAHPFFGMKSDTEESVEETMNKLRGGRY